MPPIDPNLKPIEAGLRVAQIGNEKSPSGRPVSFIVSHDVFVHVGAQNGYAYDKAFDAPGCLPTAPAGEDDYKLVDAWYQVVDGFIGLPKIHWLVLTHAERSVNVHARGYGMEEATIRLRLFAIWRLSAGNPAWACQPGVPAGRDIRA
jgi:hypothetical protein